MTLQPGQSVTQAATWDGTIADLVNNTSYAVNAFGTFEVSNPNAPQGDTATFQITNPLQGALTTDQATYQFGQPVQLTYTETNTSDQTLTISIANPLYQIVNNDLPMLPVSDPLGPSIQTITPGQTITDQFTWNPQPGSGYYTEGNLTGTFEAMVYDVPAAPGHFTANFQIVSTSAGAIVSSVTTDHAVYQGGQTVTMTFTETNRSDQPVTVPTGQDGFVFDPSVATSNLDLSDLHSPIPTGSMTLQPGQSWTQTETWPVGDPASGTYTLKIADVYDPNGHTATFEVVGASSSGNTSTSGAGDGGSSSTGLVAQSNNSSVTTNHADYKVGEVVRIRLKIPRTGEAKAVSPPARAREQITILDGTQAVFRTTRRVPASTLKHLEAGRPVTLTAVWNGRPNQPGVHALKPGSYTIDVAYGDLGSSTAIVLGREGL